MRRYLCFLTVGMIVTILGLFKFGIAFFEYKGKSEGDFEAIIEKDLKETKYMKSYIATIENKKFIIYIKKENKDLNIGDKIRLQGSYSKGETQRNFGGFDYDLYLKTKKLYGTFKVEKYELVGKDKGIIIEWKRFVSKVRNSIIETYKSNLIQDNSSLLSGILIGHITDISDKTMNDFRNSNLTHVLAISGSNFVLIIQIFKITSKRLKHKRLEQFISIICIIFFMELTGNTASVIRAGTMSILLILSKILHRKYDFWTSLSISTIVQLIYNPYIIFDLGLILSYSGVIGLVLFNELFQKKIKYSIISSTLSANILIIPIIMYNFNTISLTFLISNIFAEILILPIMIIGIISIVIRYKFVFIILDFILNLFRRIVELCAKIPFSKIYVTTPSIISVYGYFFLMFLILIKHKIKNVKRKIAIVIIIIFLANQNFEVIDAQLNKKLLINFIDVGQGDCTLIRTVGKSVLIDGGGNTDSSYDIGQNIVIPYLLDRKIKELDYIIISHFDNDHVRTGY